MKSFLLVFLIPLRVCLNERKKIPITLLMDAEAAVSADAAAAAAGGVWRWRMLCTYIFRNGKILKKASTCHQQKQQIKTIAFSHALASYMIFPQRIFFPFFEPPPPPHFIPIFFLFYQT